MGTETKVRRRSSRGFKSFFRISSKKRNVGGNTEPTDAPPAAAVKPPPPPQKTIRRKSPGSPGGIEINYANVGDSNDAMCTGGIDEEEEDNVSVITPATGFPRDSPLHRNGPHYGNYNYDGGRGSSGGEVGSRRTGYEMPANLLPARLHDDDDHSEPTVFEPFERSRSLGSGGDSFTMNHYKHIPPVPQSPENNRNNGNAGSGDYRFGVRPVQSNTTSNGEKRGNRRSSLQRGNTVADLLKKRTSWLTRTRAFRNAVDKAFDLVDADGSGDIDAQELYSGLLLIHLNLAAYAGPAACTPASREYVLEIFEKLDTDNSKTLEKEEFSLVMKILCSQVLTRIAIQWTLTLMIVPIISQYTIKYCTIGLWNVHEFWKCVDDDLNPLQRLLWKLWYLVLSFVPNWLLALSRPVTLVACHLGGKIPSSVWKSMPVTVLTIAQTSALLPLALMKVEEFFRKHAARAGDVVKNRLSRSSSKKSKSQ